MDNFTCMNTQKAYLGAFTIEKCTGDQSVRDMQIPVLLSRKRMVRFSCAVMETASDG